MQFSRYLTYSKSESAYRFIPWIIKGTLVVASFYYVVSRLFVEKVNAIETLTHIAQPFFGWIICIVVLLMLVNWWIEAIKWQIVAKPFSKISLIQSVKAIVAGVSLDSVLPLGTGAVAGKVLSLKGSNRNNLLLPVVVAQGVQSIWTVVFGSIGIYQLAQLTELGKLYVIESWHVAVFFILSLASLGMIYFWPRWKKILMRYSFRSWFSILILSLFRYMVFLSQILVLSSFLSNNISIEVLLGCATWMFFAKTIVPKPGHLGSLGVRGAAAVYFLNLAGYPYTGFVLATFVLWVINLAIPSLVGLFYIKELQLSANSNDA